VAIIDDLLASIKKEQPQEQPQNSWVSNLIDKRYQPKTERLKRSPVGFEFKRDPFDPSSYYKQLGTFRDISRLATQVTNQEVANHEEAEREKEYKANQAALQQALQGVNAKFINNDTPSIGSALGAVAGGVSRKYHLKSITSNTSKAADYWGSRYGIKTIGGYREHGSVPGSDHPKGRALDFMINNIKNGKATGTALANDVIKHYKQWNVKYVIWNRYIWTPSRGWHKYSGPSPHTDHVHVSFNK
jgi:hypothetical protein